MMTQKEIDLLQLEARIKDSKEAIENLESFKALEKNRHFKKLISEGYLENYAASLAHSLGNPNAAHLREDTMRQLDGVGSFHAYLVGLVSMGQAAKHRLESDLEQKRQIETGEFFYPEEGEE